jgi:hypothetical protein
MRLLVLYHYAIIGHAVNGSTAQCSIHVAGEGLAIRSEVIGGLCKKGGQHTLREVILIYKRTLVQWIVCIRFEEKILQPDHYRVEVQNGLPVLSQDVEADIAF